MKIIQLCLLGLFMAVSACSTFEYAPKKHPAAQWSGIEPLQIHYDIRLNRFEMGNLVANPSFEDGRTLGSTAEGGVRIKGWEILGQNVGWVDRRSADYTQDDVNSGSHAVKILRKTASELDEAEGIISDYIPVIPGNYYFSYHVRLKNIASNKPRLGVQLYDAVVIKVLFFDADKQPIDPGAWNPVNNSLIDNSDKGYSFSNFWTIDDFPWSRVRARSYNYPFSEGDVPDKTHYVRLFFGLKGTGAMWIDDIVYRYSKWNFTALERMRPYMDKPLGPADTIIPTPKHIQKTGEVLLYNSTWQTFNLPVIVLPPHPAAADYTAARLLQEKISEVIGRVRPAQKINSGWIQIFKSDSTLNDVIKAPLVFSIGDNTVYKQMQPRLVPVALHDKPQGYAIRDARIGDTGLVFLNGQTPLARYYAAATAVQLLKADPTQAVYHGATVVDYPDFLGRPCLFRGWKNMQALEDDLNSLTRLSLYKLNKVYLAFKRPGAAWYEFDGLHRQGVKDVGRWCRENGVMSLAMMVNPYSHLGFEPSAENLSGQLRYTWTHGSPQSLARLKNLYQLALNAGAETIMLQADDSVPHTGRNRRNYSLFTDEDRARFVNLQNAQAYVINELKRWVDRQYPGTRLEFCPPWYSNEHIDRSDGTAENYFRELTVQIPPEVAIMWTGPTVRSLSVDMADLYRYRSLIGRWPMFWDNTLYARNHERLTYSGYPAHYPGKVRLCNLFEPYDTYRPKAFHNNNDKRQLYINGAAASEVYKIKYATVADYEWNTAAYNPELSLWKVLLNTYGRPVAELLLRFNDAYYGVYESCLRLKSAGSSPQYVEAAETFLADMEENLAGISEQVPGQIPLLKELKHYLSKQEKRLANILKKAGKLEGREAGRPVSYLSACIHNY